MQRLAATVYWMALIAWFSALVAGASTAMSAFGHLPKLGVSVPAAAMVYPDADEAAGTFAAGYVAAPVFDGAATVMWLAMPVVGGLILVQRMFLRFPGPSWPNRLREWSLGVAIALGLLHVGILAPRMNTALRDYRAAVLQGDAATAQLYKDAFDVDHRKSTPLLKTTAYLLVGAIALSAWTFTPRRGGPRGDVQAPRLLGRSGRS